MEQVLYEHSNILGGAVVGLPDELWGEKVVAIVNSKDGGALDAEEIKAFCRNHLAKYKVPKEIIQGKKIPRNASGKILKYQIREALQMEKSLSD
ncbi:AMP-binding enzyme [Virgibacillus proomii]|uniref:AMP-binding enzyme n=1 Tax=Virgibacillus proomii TaxID=84407 RepID=UPI002816125D|nr:hypothetical protein [Virgibacillus proomii]